MLAKHNVPKRFLRHFPLYMRGDIADTEMLLLDLAKIRDGYHIINIARGDPVLNYPECCQHAGEKVYGYHVSIAV
jgi:hypothetical protein